MLVAMRWTLAVGIAAVTIGCGGGRQLCLKSDCPTMFANDAERRAFREKQAAEGRLDVEARKKELLATIEEKRRALATA